MSNKITFTASSLPSGVTMLTTPSFGFSYNETATKPYNVAILTGITKKINVAVTLSASGSGYNQTLGAALKVTYA